jgi:hypothetical protein
MEGSGGGGQNEVKQMRRKRTEEGEEKGMTR